MNKLIIFIELMITSFLLMYCSFSCSYEPPDYKDYDRIWIANIYIKKNWGENVENTLGIDFEKDTIDEFPIIKELLIGDKISTTSEDEILGSDKYIIGLHYDQYQDWIITMYFYYLPDSEQTTIYFINDGTDQMWGPESYTIIDTIDLADLVEYINQEMEKA